MDSNIIIRKKINPCALMGDVRTEHFTYLTKEQWSDSQDKVNFMGERTVKKHYW